jgi:hypothetical protein
MATRPKRPRDPNQLAKLIVDIATGEAQNDIPSESARAKAGRLGGIKGGNARAKALPKATRKRIAKKAAKVRWSRS